MTFEEFSRRLDAYIERYRSEKVKKALGWKTIRRHREELGHAARLDVRKTSEVPSHGRKSLFTAIWMGRYWQQDQFRSSFAPPNGREISFGVVRLVDLRLNALYLVRKPTLKEKAPPRLGLQRSKSVVSTTPKLVWLPTRPKKLLRNSSGCQQDCRDYSLSVGTTSSTPNSFRCQASCAALTRVSRCFAGLQLGGEVAAQSLGFVCPNRTPNPPSPQASARR